MPAHFAFILNLVQDVSVCRPLIVFARTTFPSKISVLVTKSFEKRDVFGIWGKEVEALRTKHKVEVVRISEPLDVVRALGSERGILFSASESDLHQHVETNSILRAAPSSYLKVTMQHGYECVGFLHNRAHDAAHGSRVGFGADVVVGWSDADKMTSMKASERAKLFVAGPSQLLATRPEKPSKRTQGGLVCENLHSVRFSTVESKGGFLETFEAFATAMITRTNSLSMRSHPGGRFVSRNKIALPPGVKNNDAPIYTQNLGTFRYAISAPSSILFDLMFADVPIAIWHDGNEGIDTANWSGLPLIHTLEEWIAFAERASADPGSYLEAQAGFLASRGFPEDVRARYRSLLALAA